MNLSIAIDGPAASGKSSAAGIIAKALGFERIDSGLLYRAIAHLTYEKFGTGEEVDLSSEKVKNFIESLEIQQKNTRILHDGQDITDFLRTPRVDTLVVAVAKEVYIREKTHAIQRSMIQSSGTGVVIDGRDIGTVVVPDAFLKVFVTAKDTIRAQRRSLETGEVYGEVLEKLQKRDYEDFNRRHGPLRRAADAILIENDEIDLNGTVDVVIGKLKEKLQERREEGRGDYERIIRLIDDHLRRSR